MTVIFKSVYTVRLASLSRTFPRAANQGLSIYHGERSRVPGPDCIGDCRDRSRSVRQPCGGLHTYMGRRSSEGCRLGRAPRNMRPTGRKWMTRLPAIRARTRLGQNPIPEFLVCPNKCDATSSRVARHPETWWYDRDKAHHISFGRTPW